jgi:membrane-bound metal-dependent hydrolase YbcI (DUF457 family)
MAGAAILAAVAISPDLDLLVHNHRDQSHSIGAAVAAGLMVLLFSRNWRWGSAVSLAWGSHILLDWLSNDTRPPLGVMALWPFTYDYYKASIEIFPPVSRRYWESRFWIYNLRAVAVELLLLLPLTALIVSRYRNRVRSSGPGDPPLPSGAAEDTADISDRRARHGER